MADLVLLTSCRSARTAGVCDPGELPGHLPAHPGEGGPGQAALVHPPDVSGQGGLLWGGLRTPRLDLLRHGIHQEVPASTGALVAVVVVVVVVVVIVVVVVVIAVVNTWVMAREQCDNLSFYN